MFEYLKYGIVNLDKTSGPSSHEVVSWVKRIFEADRTGHSGTLDPTVTGNLLVCLNRATRLTKQQQEMGKQYVAILQFNDFSKFYQKIGETEFRNRVKEAVTTLIAPQLQRPPAEGCAVARVLRLREIYDIKLLEVDTQQGRLLFTVDCQSGTYIRTLCFHMGLLIGCEAYMLELRRTRTGNLTQNTNLATLYDCMDAYYQYKNFNDESYLRKVVMPLEYLLKDEKKIIVKDSAVNAICYGSPVFVQCVVRYSGDIQKDDKIVLCTTKGEAVATAVATASSFDICNLQSGMVAKPNRVIMDRDVYEKAWGKGPIALWRKQLIKDGLLGPKGEVIENKTPEAWRKRYQDLEAYLKGCGSVCQNQQDQRVSSEALPPLEKNIKVEDIPIEKQETEEERSKRKAEKAARKAEKKALKESQGVEENVKEKHSKKHKE